MGCICSKGISANNRSREKETIRSSKHHSVSSRQDDIAAEGNNGEHDATVRLISNQPVDVASSPVLWKEEEILPPEIPALSLVQKPEGEVGVSGREPQLPRIVSLSNGAQAAQVVAGWPSWLAAVAGEAIKGWLPRRADSFEKLEKIGQGTYSSVYRGCDLETGKIVAMKKVRFVNMDPESVRFMAREIIILRRLNHPNVMKLESLVTSRVSTSLYLIFEYMEHDLAGLAATPGIKFTESEIKCYMQQLLSGLEHCHSCGILHRDIKGSNLLIDNNGNLKIGDFGLATFYSSSQTQPLTSRVVTLWYRPPELLLGSTDYGVGVDLWSAGCILAELFYGKPIMPGRTEVEQLHKIFKLCGSPLDEYWKKSKLPHATIFKPQNPYRRCLSESFKDFPSSVLTILDVLLAIEPESRGSAASALQSEFFKLEPLPCSPSSLPKYPPSKEFDAKLRDEEARRKKAASGKGHCNKSSRKDFRDFKAVATPHSSAKFQDSIRKPDWQPNSKISIENYNPQKESGAGFSIEPLRQIGIMKEEEAMMASHQTPGSPSNDTETQSSFRSQGANELCKFSNSVAVRGISREMNTKSHWGLKGLSKVRYNQLDGAESSRNQNWFHRLLEGPKSSRRRDEKALGKESTMGYVPKNNRIHYSGPLLPPGGNLEEMLKEHERQIQNAVRKARLEKAKSKKMNNRQAESLLHCERDRR